MNKQSKAEKKPRTKSKTQIRDLTPRKDAKGGEVSFNYTKPEVVYKQQ